MKFPGFNPRRMSGHWSPMRPPILLLPAVLCLAAGLSRADDLRSCSGITEAISDVMVSTPVAGIVSVWKFKEGNFVRESDVILELDKDLEELETARRKLVMELRKTDLDAVRTLVNKSSISVRKEELEKAEADYKVAVVEHDIAAEQLRRRLIIAPCAGYLAEIARDPGEACQAYQPLVRLVDTRRCYFVANVEAKTAVLIRPEQAVRLELETGSTPVVMPGKVVFISPVVDPASGLQKIKVLFDNPDGIIHPGVAGKMIVDQPLAAGR